MIEHFKLFFRRKDVGLVVLVAALGYFVDIYDLLLFSIVRVKSLKGIGVDDSRLLDDGILLINVQMGGLLLGGILWGVLGDRRGRLSVLFGSILTYSLANIANAFVTSLEAYAWLRLIAGIGLAGELGAGITLVSELLPQEVRGLGTTLVAGVGICGGVFAAIVGDAFTWRTAYAVGGAMGLCLLILRLGVAESPLYQRARISETRLSHGNFFALFSNRTRFLKYIEVILTGLPIWFVIGILITFSPELGKAMGMSPIPSAGTAVLFSYSGLALGDICSGLISQKLKSRKQSILAFLILTAFSVSLYFWIARYSLTAFYFICGLLGLGVGYWAMFVTVAAEQFGTNMRATVATTSPNFVRGAVIPLTIAFQSMKQQVGTLESAAIVGIVTLAVAFYSLYHLEETYSKDLNYLEV